MPRARLNIEGNNELPQPGRRTPFRIVIEVLREPMLTLLLVGGIVYLALGDLKEATVLVAFATMSIVIVLEMPKPVLRPWLRIVDPAICCRQSLALDQTQKSTER